MRFRMATAAEGGAGNFNQPGPPEAPNAATINSTSGVYTWDTHGATLNTTGDTFYSTQIMIENLDSQGQVITKTPVDFFIRLIPQTNNPPRFNYPPTPPDGTTFTIAAGNTIAFTVQADDADLGDTVTLAVINLPNGAVFPIPAPANPVSSMLSWTPTAADVGPHVINFTATDNQGASDFTSVTINVLLNTPTVTRTSVPKNTATPTLPPPPPTSTPTLPPPPPTVTVCPSGTPTRVPTPPYTPAPGCSPNPGSRLSAVIIDHATTTDAVFTNRSQTCSYPIGLAIYRKLDNNIEHQELYDYRLAVIAPNSTMVLTVNNPTCAYQGDAFWGDLIQSFAGGERYGVRRLSDTDGHGNNWCPPACSTGVTVKPKTKPPSDH
jgi:hypothetical protein